MMGPLLAVAALTCLAVAASTAAAEVRAAQASNAGSHIVVFRADPVRAGTEARSLGRRRSRTKV